MQSWYDDPWEKITTYTDPHTCGTVGCLLGTDQFYEHWDTCCRHQTSNGYFLTDVLDSQITSYCSDLIHIRKNNEYGLTSREMDYLFLGQFITNYPYWNCRSKTNDYYRTIERDILHTIKSAQAIRRLRKFIYFKLKQAEIHEAWNERHHTKHAQAENTSCFATETINYEGICKVNLLEAKELAHA